MLKELLDSKRILIVKLSSIGDVIMATPVAEVLRKLHPDAYLAWVVEEKSKDMVLGNPYLDDVIIWSRNSSKHTGMRKTGDLLRGLGELKRRLHACQFDAAIDFQGLLRSALVGKLSGARYLIGSEEARECASLLYNVHLSTSEINDGSMQQYVMILKQLGLDHTGIKMHIPIDARDEEFAQRFITDSLSEHPGLIGTIALCPATTWRQKFWTEDGWAKLGSLLFRRYGLMPLFLGARADRELVQHIREGMGCPSVDAAGMTTLRQASALIKHSIMTVGVDTGLLHVSRGLDKPTIGLFGPTGWSCFPKVPNFVVVSKPMECMPCVRHPICTDIDCMGAITPADILAVVDGFLSDRQSLGGTKVEGQHG